MRGAWVLMVLLAGVGSGAATAAGSDLSPVGSVRDACDLGGDLLGLGRDMLHPSAARIGMAVGLGTVSFAAYTLDNRVRTLGARRHATLEDISAAVTHFGDILGQMPLELGFLAGGIVLDDPRLTAIARDAEEASMFGAGLITPMITLISGRNLPNKGENAFRFHLFRRGRVSFPSGHTTEAFAVAAVLDRDLRSSLGYVQTGVVYTLAALVGLSRIYDNKHYLSDVVLGAGIGAWVGSWVTQRQGLRRGIAIVPDPVGFRVVMTL